MQLINEQDDLAFALFNFVQNALQTFLKLAAVLSTGDQSAHIQAEHGAVFQVFGHIAAHDTLGKALSDSRFTNTSFTDQHRVVLALTGQDADNIADLGITANDGIQLVGTGGFHQILAIFFQGVIGRFGVISGHALVAAHGGQHLHELFRCDAKLLEQLASHAAGALQHAHKDMLHADIFILHLLGLLFSGGQGLVQLIGDIDFIGVTAGTRHMRQLGNFFRCGSFKGTGVNVHLGQQLGDQAILLLGQGHQHVLLFQRLVGIFNCQTLGSLQGFHRFLGKLVGIHIANLLYRQR